MTTTAEPAFGIPKARWPALLHVAVFWFAYLTILIVVGMLKAAVPPNWGPLFWGLASSLLIAALTAALLCREERRAGDIGLDGDWASGLRFGWGVLIALATYALIVLLVSAILGPIRFVRTAGMEPLPVGLTVCTTLALAGMEELGFRGYPLRTLVPAIGYWPAQIIVALAFGPYHRWGFHYSWAAVLLGVIPCALLFGAAAMVSRGLAMPIGLHAGLNLAQWSVGEKGGIWTGIVDPAHRARVDTMSPIIVVGVTMMVTLALWGWDRPRRVATAPA